jgi:hypothetical protein
LPDSCKRIHEIKKALSAAEKAIERSLLLEYRTENLTGFTDLHFFFPIFLNRSFTYGPINKPAKITG